MQAEYSIAVVLINWNHAGDTIRCVDRLLQWKRLNPYVLVVDNASGPVDRELLINTLTGKAELLLNASNRGFAGASNRGIERALEFDIDYVALGNYDATFTEEAMICLLETLVRNPRIGAVGPLLREGEKIYAGGRDIARFLETRRPLARSGSPQQLTVVDYVPGTLILIRSSVFGQCGFLDEDYFFSGEVADYCARIRAEGLKCAITRDATVDHALEKSTHRNDLYAYYSFRNRFLYVRKNYAGLKSVGLRFYWSLLTALAIARAVLSANRPQARALALAWREGLAGRWGNRNELFIREEKQ
ncbi:MAG: glycosyltransferase family 2 protein [Candidatus Erginobacter occultus]|nr:glycosyltransferase family 2 protein [Candidatus Erginobacter occultus]